MYEIMTGVFGRKNNFMALTSGALWRCAMIGAAYGKSG
jgi:hypothetical protein